MTIVATSIPRGTWGRQIREVDVSAEGDSDVSGVGLAWPPPFFAVVPDTAQVQKIRVGAFVYILNVYLLSFDTSFLRGISRVESADLILTTDGPVLDEDDFELRNDAFKWDEAGEEDYTTDEQAGVDGSFDISELDPLSGGEELCLICRPSAIQQERLTQFRLTLSGGENAGDNHVEFHMPGTALEPRLRILYTNRVALHEMI